MTSKMHSIQQWTSQLINSKYIGFLKRLDSQISKNFQDAEIFPRPVHSNGLWCCLLIPAILLLNNFIHHVSPVYRLATFLSIGLLCYSILCIIFLSISCLVLKEEHYGGCLPSGIVSALLIYAVLKYELFVSLVLSIPMVCAYKKMISVLLVRYPNTFTIGEAMVVSQGSVLFVTSAVAQCWGQVPQEFDPDMFIVKTCVYTIYSTVGLIVTALCYLKTEQRNVTSLANIIGFTTLYELLWLHLVLGPTAIVKILSFIFMGRHRVSIFTTWLLLLVSAVAILVAHTRSAKKTTSTTRKSFHVLASIVFTSGILYDVNFMALAAGLGLGLMILVEALRKAEIEPVSPALQSVFETYSDVQDSGSFAMTPIYLFVGLSCPLLLVTTTHDGAQLELLSGVLATGVGDTAASWFGERYGYTKWPDGKRTLEGTACNITAQVLTVYFLYLLDLLNTPLVMLRAVVAAVTSGLVEAHTKQVDNLILPLVTLIALQFTTLFVIFLGY